MMISFTPRRKTVQEHKDFLLLFVSIQVAALLASVIYSVPLLYAVGGGSALAIALGLGFRMIGVFNLNKRLFASLEEALRKENLVMTRAKSLDFRKNYELSLMDVDTQEFFIGDLPGEFLVPGYKRTLYIGGREPVNLRVVTPANAGISNTTISSSAESGLYV